MREEMSKAVKLDNVINLLIIDDVKIPEGTIKTLEDVLEKHLRVYMKAFDELYMEEKRND